MTHDRPASTGEMDSSRSCPYKHMPASSRSESRGPRPVRRTGSVAARRAVMSTVDAGGIEICRAGVIVTRSGSADAMVERNSITMCGGTNLEPVLSGVSSSSDVALNALDVHVHRLSKVEGRQVMGRVRLQHLGRLGTCTATKRSSTGKRRGRSSRVNLCDAIAR